MIQPAAGGRSPGAAGDPHLFSFLHGSKRFSFIRMHSRSGAPSALLLAGRSLDEAPWRKCLSGAGARTELLARDEAVPNNVRKRAAAKPSAFPQKEEPAQGGLFFYSISSEYQVWTDLLPDFGRNFGVEVFLYQRLLLSSVGEGLDKISTEEQGLRDTGYGIGGDRESRIENAALFNCSATQSWVESWRRGGRADIR
jgi:hypothetical protein